MVRRLSAAGGYIAAGLALIIFWWLQRHGLLASTPYWLLVVFLAVSCAADVTGRLLQRRWPGSVRCDRARLATAAATTTLVLYATGWGSVLIIGFAVGATQVLGQSARPDWRWAYGCDLVAIALGEAAVQLGIAPSLIGIRLAHAVAFAGAVCLAVVLWILGEALLSAQRNEQLALEREERLVTQATTDALTGLANRTLFGDRLNHALMRRQPVGGCVAVMIVDLDGFKNVNDSLGHDAGDRLLIAVADRFRRLLRGFDTIARLGGDEFAILVDDLDTAGQPQRVAQRVLDALVTPLPLANRTVAIGASIGIAFADQPATKADELLSHADAAMYRAKREGKGCYRVFEAGMHAAAVERMNLEQALRAAIHAGELTVYYQPIIDTRTGQISSLEALARWRHPTRGLISPGTFIPLAEESGMIIDLGHTVLLEACRQTRQWHTNFAHLQPGISVNVSRLQLAHPSFHHHVADALNEANLEPSTLTVEVTESVLAAEFAPVLATLDKLRQTGIRVAIDDFGTGYSSLAALGELPIDIIKIDKRFIDHLTRDRQGRGFVNAILELARTLQVETIAEGVEDEQQLSALSDLGCTHVQGYLYSPPIPADQTHNYLARQPIPAAQPS